MPVTSGKSRFQRAVQISVSVSSDILVASDVRAVKGEDETIRCGKRFVNKAAEPYMTLLYGSLISANPSQSTYFNFCAVKKADEALNR